MAAQFVAAAGNPLILAVREARFEVRLEPDGTAPHIPGSVFELSVEQEAQTALILRRGGMHEAVLAQSKHRLPRCIGIARQRWDLAPTTIRPLFLEERLTGLQTKIPG